MRLLHFLCLLAFVTTAHSEVQLPAIFSDHVVLQRDRPLPVWGWAAPGEQVNVALGTQKAAVIAGSDGRWFLRLAAQAMSKVPLTLTVAGKNRLEVKDVLLGDLWLCSGQSNMEFGLGNCNAGDDIKAADLPLIRHFRTEYNFASEPANDVKGSWSVCNPGTAGGFSAVGFYFARKVHAETGVPIGLLTNAVGGTNIELWISKETLLGTPALAPYAKQMRESLEQYQRDLGEVLPSMEQWTARSRTAQKTAQPMPMPPRFPDFPFSEKTQRPRCVTLHNGHIAPLVPMSLRGVLWYQGENNAGDKLYVEKVRAMLADWRKWFGDPALPFYFVQIAAWDKSNDNPAHTDGWAEVRDRQRRCLEIPHTGMAVTIDIGDAGDMHPKNKADAGERLALWALANEYGKRGLVVSGPLFRELKIEGRQARLTFDSLGGGLIVAKKEGRAPAVEEKGAKLRRFAIAGADKKWVWADAVIQGDSLLVGATEVPAPVAVRYAWATNPDGANLYNRAGLPASPFRTDDW